MHEVLLRFRVLKNDKIFEVLLDDRLSFRENLRLLSELTDEKLEDYRIYDLERNIFLDDRIPLSRMKIAVYAMFYLL